ncbi:hypothetical protein LguiA_034193 [Lonicera macranthoides]
MQGGRGSRDPFFDPFANFGGGFGPQRSLMSPFFGGRDPFDDPFFTRPFGGMFESNFFEPIGSPFMGGHAPGFLQPQLSQPQPNRSRGPVIEELNSDDEIEEEAKKEKKDNPKKHGRSSKEPYVEDPDDEAEARKNKQIQYSNEVNSGGHRRLQPQARSFTFQSSTVSYGGSNGAYYTSSTTKRTGSDGLTFEESKEADSTTGQASHKLLRGIHDKGHAVSRKLKSDGTVDTMQTLHNLNEGELAGFEEAWKGNARKHLPGWTEGIGMGHDNNAQTGPQSNGGWALPSTERSHYSGNVRPNDRERGVSYTSRQNPGRMRADDGGVRTGSLRGSSTTRTAGGKSKMDKAGKH